MKKLVLLSLLISFLSLSLSVKSQTATCGAPTGLVSSAVTQTNATVKWDKVSTAGYYTIYYGTSSVNITSFETKDTLYNLTGLTPGTTYYWAAQTYCVVPNSNTYTASTITEYASFKTLASPPPCAATSKLYYSNLTSTSVTISWNSVSTACSYNIKYYEYGKSDTLTLTSTDKSYNFTGLTPSTNYHWLVQTVCCGQAGKSPWSNHIAIVTPAPPTCYPPTKCNTTNITQTSATFSWNKVSGNCGYNIGYYNLSNTTIAKVTRTVTDTIVNVDGLLPGDNYQWYVNTVCCAGNTSDTYSENKFTTQSAPTCSAPNVLKSSNLTPTSVTLTWNHGGACSYNLKYYAYGTTDTIKINTTDTTYNLTGLTPSTYYHWMVQTDCCKLNELSPYSSYQIFTTPALPACNPPTKPTTLNITQNSAEITWNKLPNACSYTIWISTTSEFTTYKSLTTKDTAIFLDSLKANTYYVWKIQTNCCNQTTPGAFSSTIYFKTLPLPTCAAPTGLLIQT